MMGILTNVGVSKITNLNVFINMTVFVEQTMKCEICGKNYKSFGNEGGFQMIDDFVIRSICPKCSEVIKFAVDGLIKYLKVHFKRVPKKKHGR